MIAARRGPAHSAFTLPELIGLTSTCEVVLDAADHDLVRATWPQDRSADAQQARDPQQARRRVGAGDAAADPAGLPPDAEARARRAARRRRRVRGDRHRRASAGIDAGLVLTSIGYRGKPIRDLPFDDDAAVVPNDGGRVVDPDRASRCGAATSPAGSSAVRPGSSAPTSRARRRRCTTWSPTTTRDCSPTRRASRRRWTSSCAAGGPTWSTPRAGRRSTPRRSPAAATPAARQVHHGRRHAGRRGGRARRPSMRERVLAGLLR